MSGISFFQPFYLWGFLFLGAVVLIHFLRKRSARRFEFSTLRFFKAAAVKSSRMRRLRKLLLFINRCLIVILIVLIFAGPYAKNDPAAIVRNPRVTVFAWIDPTMSMGYIDKGESLIKRASLLADSFAMVLPHSAGSFRYDDRKREFIETGLTKQDQACRYGPAGVKEMAAAFESRRKTISDPLLVLFSDYQEPTTSAIDTFLLNNQDDFPLFFVSLTPQTPWNFAMNCKSDPHNRGIIASTVKAMRRPLENGVLIANVNGMRAGRKEVSVKQDDSGFASMELSPDLISASGSVDLMVDDPLPFDNEDYFCASAHATVRVLIAGNPAANMVISSALKAAGKELWDPILMKDGEEITTSDVDSAGLVIINQLAHPSRAIEALASGKVAEDKAVIFALATEEPGISWSNSCAVSLLPTMPLLKPVVDKAPHVPLLPDTVSMLWRGFPDMRNSETAVYSYMGPLPGEPLSVFENSAPFVSRYRDRIGRTWILLSTPIGITSSNNLCETGFYVPFIDRITRQAISYVKSGSVRMIAGYPRPNPYVGSGRGANVFAIDNTLFARWEHQAQVLFEKPGAYRIVPDGEPAYPVTVKADPAESELTYRQVRLSTDRKRMMLLFNKEQFRLFIHDFKNSRRSMLWFLLLFLIISEILLWEPRNTKQKIIPLDR